MAAIVACFNVCTQNISTDIHIAFPDAFITRSRDGTKGLFGNFIAIRLHTNIYIYGMSDLFEDYSVFFNLARWMCWHPIRCAVNSIRDDEDIYMKAKASKKNSNQAKHHPIDEHSSDEKKNKMKKEKKYKVITIIMKTNK